MFSAILVLLPTKLMHLLYLTNDAPVSRSFTKDDRGAFIDRPNGSWDFEVSGFDASTLPLQRT